jgi:hypothetical protein
MKKDKTDIEYIDTDYIEEIRPPRRAKAFLPNLLFRVCILALLLCLLSLMLYFGASLRAADDAALYLCLSLAGGFGGGAGIALVGAVVARVWKR